MDDPRKKDSELSTILEFWQFLKTRKKFWLAPILFLLLAMGFLLVITEGSAVAPFVYTLF